MSVSGTPVAGIELLNRKICLVSRRRIPALGASSSKSDGTAFVDLLGPCLFLWAAFGVASEAFDKRSRTNALGVRRSAMGRRLAPCFFPAAWSVTARMASRDLGETGFGGWAAFSDPVHQGATACGHDPGYQQGSFRLKPSKSIVSTCVFTPFLCPCSISLLPAPLFFLSSVRLPPFLSPPPLFLSFFFSLLLFSWLSFAFSFFFCLSSFLSGERKRGGGGEKRWGSLLLCALPTAAPQTGSDGRGDLCGLRARYVSAHEWP